MAHGQRLLASLLACKALALGATSSFALEAALGVAAVDEGDDRRRPAAMLHAGFNDNWQSNALYYGRVNGPVREETYLASVSRRWSPFSSKNVVASLGAAILDEKLTIAYEDAADAAQDLTENNYNAGLAFGLTWLPFRGTGPLYFAASWDAHIFGAGQGTFFLSTGRKESISLLLGMEMR